MSIKVEPKGHVPVKVWIPGANGLVFAQEIFPGTDVHELKFPSSGVLVIATAEINLKDAELRVPVVTEVEPGVTEEVLVPDTAVTAAPMEAAPVEVAPVEVAPVEVASEPLSAPEAAVPAEVASEPLPTPAPTEGVDGNGSPTSEDPLSFAEPLSLPQ